MLIDGVSQYLESGEVEVGQNQLKDPGIKRNLNISILDDISALWGGKEN